MKILILTFFILQGTCQVSAEDIEPKFNDIKRNDIEMKNAYSLASDTMNTFIEKVKNGGTPMYMAKLSFRDPERPEQIIYLWLNNVVYHSEEKMLSGMFFEVPSSLKKWHQVGQRLGFEPDDVFDWMINNDGEVDGGFTIRVTRSRLSSDEEKIKYDEYIGIKSYNPISDY